jgi:hypothetical protein
MTAVAAIDADTRRMTRASGACRRLMTIPGVGQLTALAFVAAIGDPSRIGRLRDVGAYLGLAPRRYQSGEADYVGGISKCRDRRMRTLLYEAANVVLTRYKGQLKLKDWAFAIDQPCARLGSLWSVASQSSCTRCSGTKPSSARLRAINPPDRRPHRAPARSDARGREQTTAPILLHAANQRPTAISTEPPCTQLTPSSDSERAENAGIPRRRCQEEPLP